MERLWTLQHDSLWHDLRLPGVRCLSRNHLPISSTGGTVEIPPGAQRVIFGPDPVMSGDGHGRTYDKPVTLGMLWDTIEGRLLRGCSCEMTLFLSGCPLADDPTASALEKAFWNHARVATGLYGKQT